VKAINASDAFSLQKSKQSLKGTDAERDICRGSSASTAAKFPVVPAVSAPVVITKNIPNHFFCHQGSHSFTVKKIQDFPGPHEKFVSRTFLEPASV